MVKILSMTGCGYARIQGADSIITVEVKSVNSRYLDLNIKMPRMYQRVEERVKTLLSKYTSRGKVDIYIFQAKRFPVLKMRLYPLMKNIL